MRRCDLFAARVGQRRLYVDQLNFNGAPPYDGVPPMPEPPEDGRPLPW
jgi:hypothetical protein